MNLSLEDVQTIHAIAEALIATLEKQIVLRRVTEGNIPLDAVINCLCYTMKHAEPPLEDKELLRRVKIYFESMDRAGAPGKRP